MITDMAAKKAFFIPSEFYDWPQHRHLDEADFPSLPMPVKSIRTSDTGDMVPMPFHLMKTAPLVASPFKTGTTPTMPAESIENLDKKNCELSLVRHCSVALSRLARYALGPSQTILNQDEYKDDHVVRKYLKRPVASSWAHVNTTTTRSSIATAAQQASAFDQLASDYVTQDLDVGGRRLCVSRRTLFFRSYLFRTGDFLFIRITRTEEHQRYSKSTLRQESRICSYTPCTTSIQRWAK